MISTKTDAGKDSTPWQWTQPADVQRGLGFSTSGVVWSRVPLFMDRKLESLKHCSKTRKPASDLQKQMPPGRMSTKVDHCAEYTPPQT